MALNTLDSGQSIQSSYKDSPGALITINPTTGFSVLHAPAAATQATITKSAGAAGVKHVCTSIAATLAAGGTAQTPINVYLRDGATGTGTIIWAGSVSAPVNSAAIIALTDLSIVGSAATAMTLEFSAAGVAASVQAVTLTGYDTT
jgi:hypothetical protein